MPLYIVLGQQRACMPVYIGKSGDLVRCYRCLTDTQTTEYRATQLLYSIQFKLSHAMSKVSPLTPRFATSMCDPYTSTHTIITVTVKKCHHSPPDLPPLCVTHIPALIQSLQQTRPSILCVTQKGLLCLYILYWVSKGLVCLYILEKVEIWSGVTDASQTHRQQNIELLSFSTVSSLS